MTEIKRKHIRFDADPNTFVAVKIAEKPAIGGLAITESRGGCSAVFITHGALKENTLCHVKVGAMKALEAEIRWVKVIDKELVKVGFQYLQ